jgi:hypothetical protein
MCWWKKRKIKYVLPHPEEPVDTSKTMENTVIEPVIKEWQEVYHVPEAALPFWNTVQVIVSLTYSVPGATDSASRMIWIRPEWSNKGVIAHEMCHISYYQLSSDEKYAFEVTFNNERQKEGLLKWAYNEKGYMQSGIIEAHADCYRYLGSQMPESLKGFYPYLFQGA